MRLEDREIKKIYVMPELIDFIITIANQFKFNIETLKIKNW